MNVKAGELDRMWAKLGFEIDSRAADVKANLWVDGVLIVRTMRSHGSGKLSGKIPAMIRQQMKLNETQFSDAVRCPLKAEGYLEILREKGLIRE